jgi:sigma-B regulation protein RsbU (phosphoserine phosphatase)
MKELSESRVLIVDDVKENVDVLVHALGGEYKLSVALDGESALRIARKTPPDLVLLDIVMPGIDGFEVCRRLRAARETQETPVMFLSSLEDVQNKALGFEVGGNDYLTKPFEALEARARVRSLLKAKAFSDAVKEARERELTVAKEIQAGILPPSLEPCTKGTGLDVAALMEAARQVGGDLYEAMRLGDRVVVVVGDVSGKGVPASLFMAVTVTLIRTMARIHELPQDVLRHVNDELAAHNPRGMFVTLGCVSVDIRTGHLNYASAGHPSPILVRPGEAPRAAFRDNGPVAGLFPAIDIPGEEMTLGPGDTLVFYSDGVSEAFDPQGELLGEENLIAGLGSGPARTAADTVAHVLAMVRAHAKDAPQSDDITVLALRREP